MVHLSAHAGSTDHPYLRLSRRCSDLYAQGLEPLPAFGLLRATLELGTRPDHFRIN